MSAAMKMEYTPIPLATVFDVDAIVNISYYKLENGYVFSGESHSFWEFIYVDRGSIVVTAGADKYFLKAGELAFHCPYEFHSFQSVGASDVMVVAFCCESEAMHRLEKKVLLLHQREKQCLKPLMDEAQQAYQYFENDPALVNLRKKPTAPWGSDQLIKLYLEQLFICICRRDDNVRFSQRAITSTQFHQHLLLAQQARDYLAAHYSEAITLPSLAAALGISVSQLKRVFHEQIGQSMVRYLTALRIGEAKRLIREGNLTFTQIAERIGIESIYYFSNLFKKQTGMSPTEYEKTLKE